MSEGEQIAVAQRLGMIQYLPVSALNWDGDNVLMWGGDSFSRKLGQLLYYQRPIEYFIRIETE